MSKSIAAIKVTDVDFRKNVKGNFCGYATIEINKVLKINGFKVMHGKNGFFVAMPSHEADDGEYYSDVYIDNDELYKNIQEDVINAILGEYDEDDLIDKKLKNKSKKKTSAKSKKSTKSKKSDEDDEDDEDDGLPL